MLLKKMTKTDDNDAEPIIPLYLFEFNKRSILLKLPFCGNNEVKSKRFFKNNPSFYEK